MLVGIGPEVEDLRHLPPLFTGAMLTHSAVGWPLVCGGLLKALYDLLLLVQFRAVAPRDEDD